MDKLYVAFLWHMHQPLYKDPGSGKYNLPWVRLHALKGYADMLGVLDDFPRIRQTFNFSPSLMMQLEDYASGKASDVFLELSRKPATELLPSERVFILRNFFSTNWDTMVVPYPRYRELLEKRGLRAAPEELEERQKTFSDEEIRDLQVWFNLTWFGYYTREKEPDLKAYFHKQRGFSETEKNLLLDKQRELIGSILPRYRKAQEEGRIEVSVSPFYHPILPLLCNQEAARNAMPDVLLPKEAFKHPEDARWHVVRAVEMYEHVFRRKPRGMWPSEGSVSVESAEIITGAGLKWMASDEDILLQTLGRQRSAELIYAPYRLQLGSADINMVFRDRSLSDLISFTYAKNPPKDAARDLVAHLKNIHAHLQPSAGEHLVSIILDGENPWEYYPDGGRDFLRELYSLLSDSSTIETASIGSYLEKYPPRMSLGRIFSGSWISHNFNIWIGRREDNIAWDQLARTRAHLVKELERRLGDIPPEITGAAWEHIYAAEGSDWFWWYGDDFTSAFDSEFDQLFRAHLIEAYRALGMEPPEALFDPIINVGAARPTEQPTGFLNPVIDGLITHYYEWIAAGKFDVLRSGGAMNIAETLVSNIFWGFNLENLFFRIDTSAPPRLDELGDVSIELYVESSLRLRVHFKLPADERGNGGVELFISEDGEVWKSAGVTITAGIKRIIELAVGISSLGLHPDDVVRFHVIVRKGKLELERWPRSGYLEFKVPGPEYEATIWMA
jgi:alpha-amylase/alpha-mannosidase (GH57 family)